MIIRPGYEGIKSSLLELVDTALPATHSDYIQVENDINEILLKLVSNNNGSPYRLGELNMIGSGPNTIITNLKLIVPPQKWDNVLDIKEFENVTKMLRAKMTEKNKAIKRCSIEFVEEDEHQSDFSSNEIKKE